MIRAARPTRRSSAPLAVRRRRVDRAAPPLPPPTPQVDVLRRLAADPAFSLTNPNRLRATLGVFASANPAHFHRADGAGYAFLGEVRCCLWCLWDCGCIVERCTTTTREEHNRRKRKTEAGRWRRVTRLTGATKKPGAGDRRRVTRPELHNR